MTNVCEGNVIVTSGVVSYTALCLVLRKPKKCLRSNAFVSLCSSEALSSPAHADKTGSFKKGT